MGRVPWKRNHTADYRGSCQFHGMEGKQEVLFATLSMLKLCLRMKLSNWANNGLTSMTLDLLLESTFRTL